jgi:outer membrane lipoprotein-sorting protein
MVSFRACVAGILIGGLPVDGWGGEPDGHELAEWLAWQTNLASWSASVQQTRVLKSLAQPLTNSGRVWFQAPNLFRWQLGDPPRTVVVREPQRLVLLYPELRRAEIYPLTAKARGPWRDSLALIEAGFPRDRADLESRFAILSSVARDSVLEVQLRPKARDARRWMERIGLRIDTARHRLLATELFFTDGSRLRNDFSDPVHNPTLEEALFRPVWSADYKVVEPATP